ncbi:MAG: hypothetical protein JWM11_2341 [Planctomycetaceae bacterium]|nr:hypothetical protein [Planctomycetaceae bacterium]
MARKPKTPADQNLADEAAKAGRDWQEYVNQLLSIHHDNFGQIYQPVPDQTQGDHGLEGFVDETGDGYQAYSGELSKSANELTKHQKKKIKDDLEKLAIYADWWAPLFANRKSKLKNWTLVVPECVNREVLHYASEQSELLRLKNLPFISDGFRVYIRTPKEFPAARATLCDPDLAKQLIVIRSATDKQLTDQEAGAPDFLGKIDEKLRKLSPEATAFNVIQQRKKRLLSYLRCENYLTDLLDKFPSHRDQLDGFLALKAEQIEANAFSDGHTPRERFRETKDDLESSFETIAVFANPTQQLVLLEGTISKWLGECTLNFAS